MNSKHWAWFFKQGSIDVVLVERLTLDEACAA
jgi:hypothetical protein